MLFADQRPYRSQTDKTASRIARRLWPNANAGRKSARPMAATDLTQATPRALSGIACVIGAVCLYVTQDAMMKSLMGALPVWWLLFARSLVAVLLLVPLIRVLGAPHRLLSPLWPLHLARGALFTLGFSAFYAAFPFMGLAEVSTIFFSAPLITAALSALWLREPIGAHRIGALLVGFAGVLIAMNPTGETFSWIALLPLFCAASYAVAQILARRIGERDSTLTVGLQSLGFAGLIVLPIGWGLDSYLGFGPDYAHLRFAMPDLSGAALAWMGAVGLLGMLGFLFISRAYQLASASLVAPFDYTYLPIAAVLGYAIWDEAPGAGTLTGMALIVASGLYLGLRELRAARRRDIAPATAETAFVPGATGPVTTHEDEGPA